MKQKQKISRYVCYQPNPTNIEQYDCIVRATAKIFGFTWIQAFDLLTKRARQLYAITNANKVIIDILHERFGFHLYVLNNRKRRLTFVKYASLHQTEKSILFSAQHACACIGGTLYDSWDPSNEKIEMIMTNESLSTEEYNDITDDYLENFVYNTIKNVGKKTRQK